MYIHRYTYIHIYMCMHLFTVCMYVHMYISKPSISEWITQATMACKPVLLLLFSCQGAAKSFQNSNNKYTCMYVCVYQVRERSRLIKGGTELLLKPKCILHCGQDCNWNFYARLQSCGNQKNISMLIPKHVFRLARNTKRWPEKVTFKDSACTVTTTTHLHL